MDFTYIDRDDALARECKKMRSFDVLGIDLECENNLHHYGTHLSIIQVTGGDRHWIIDALAIKNMKPMLDILIDRRIVKIFHDVDFDFRMLEKSYGIRPHNVFDTLLAAAFLGRNELGLGSLLAEYFHVEKESKYQMADWLKRPLDKGMLAYAVKDTVYLPRLREKLIAELKRLGRLEWVLEECAYLETKDYTYREQEFIDVKGVKGLAGTERAIFKRLFEARDKLAEKVDRPAHFIMSAKQMVEWAQKPPTFNQWKEMRRVHPAVRSHAKMFHDAVQKGKKEIIPWNKPKVRRMSGQQKKMLERLTEVRDTVADSLNLPRHLLMTKEQMKQAALSGDLLGLRNWQRKLVEAKL